MISKNVKLIPKMVHVDKSCPQKQNLVENYLYKRCSTISSDIYNARRCLVVDKVMSGFHIWEYSENAFRKFKAFDASVSGAGTSPAV